MYEPNTSRSDFPLYTDTIILFLQSSRIKPSLTMVLIRSIIHLVQKPLDVFIISLTTPVEPAAFRILTPLISAATSSSEMRQHGPITSGQSSSPSQPFSTFTAQMRSFGEEFFTTGCTSWCKPHVWVAVSNSSKSYFLTHIRLMQLHNLCAHLLYIKHQTIICIIISLCSSLKIYLC